MHVVVLGGGYAGVAVVRRLERLLPADVDLTLVTDTPDHVLQHELHRVIRRPAVANDIVVSVPQATDRARIHVATVEGINREHRSIDLSTGELAYDYGVVCLGAETAFHGLDGVRDRATPLKRIGHALAIRETFFDVIESTAGRVRIVVGGAGLSGVQVAGELAALTRETSVADRTTVTLLERLDTVAPGFPERFGEAISQTLEDAGVEIRTGAAVTGADDEVVEIRAGEPVQYDQLIWTGGIRGPETLGGDRPRVGPDLRLDDGTFGCGDAVRVEDTTGELVPASAQAARREARTAAANVASLVRRDRTETADKNGSLEEFQFRSPGWVVSVGDDAVATIGSRVLTGAPARAAKATVGATYLAELGERRRAIGLLRTELRADVGDSNDT
ncbi:FAD-dependent pyridine nucleotide-disulfide oxidoreductase [Halovivax asiaticus JCM 14624]|uniref:FAD-dependent pyridine nucleotide-disulfide oxidoreductase n=1 Tax=Halovivax asiaticus JCM 14624 TaxID=1227490 RepID=M0BP72_9EURY|nr:FAD-dependent oxidoreductase [Halovivax asiaticus]ELZ12681.1 FAD-dependent pyridine nucleotide-disulfide oxidoreductase [Halovivax asiaticus JCM 14624]